MPLYRLFEEHDGEVYVEADRFDDAVAAWRAHQAAEKSGASDPDGCKLVSRRPVVRAEPRRVDMKAFRVEVGAPEGGRTYEPGERAPDRLRAGGPERSPSEAPSACAWPAYHRVQRAAAPAPPVSVPAGLPHAGREA